MKKFVANILCKLLLYADKPLLVKVFNNLQTIAQGDKYNYYRKQYRIHDSFRFNGPNIQLYGKGEIVLGSNSYIGSYSTIQAAEGYRVEIGRNCAISHNVRIYTTSVDGDSDFNGVKNQTAGNVIIGDAVWIGANVFIKEGITIGENAVVGANSVITKDIEANAIYGGVPAKLIRKKRFNGHP